MRIEKIKFKNINSLKGEHEVDFSKEPLRDSGIFAIIGPTGSGKSTLLDVITLSLFNRIPRFSKAISKNEIEGNGSVMTHYTDDAYASIEYTTSKGSYISEWKVERARTGKLKDHEMHIFNKQEGKYLGLKKSEVPSKNEELIGLNYDQFVKSIILSQGQFSKFLKANKNERGILLEKITGTEIYRKIGSRVYEKYIEAKKKVETQESNFEFIDVMDTEERTSIETQLKNSISKLSTLENSLKTLTANVEIKRQINTLLQQQENAELRIKYLNSQKINIQINIAKLVQYEDISPLRGDIAIHSEGNKKLSTLKIRIQEFNKKIAFNEIELNKAIAKMSQLVKSKVTELDFIKTMQSFEKEINQLVYDRTAVVADGKKIRNRISIKCKNNSYDIASSLENERRADKGLLIIETRISELNNILNKANLNTQSQRSEIIAQVKEKSDASKLLAEILSYSKEYQQNNIEYEQHIQKEIVLKKSIDTTSPQLSSKQEQLGKLKVHLKEIQKNKENSLALFKLNDYRDNLIQGEKCPLCGSLDHPLAGHTEKEDSHFDQEIKQTENGIDIEGKEIQKLNQLIVEINTQLRTISEQKEKLETKKTENINWFKANKTEPQNQTLLESQIQKIESNIESLNQCGEALNEYKWLSDLKIEFDTLRTVVNRYNELNDTITNKYDGKDVTADCNQLQDEFTKYAEALKDSKQGLRIIQEEHEEELKKIHKVEITLIPKIKALGFEKIEDIKQSFLSEEQVQKLKSEKENYDKKSISLETEQNTITKNLLKLKQSGTLDNFSLEVLKNKLNLEEAERNTLLKENGANQNKLNKDDESKKKLKSLSKKLDKQKLDLEKLELLNRLIGDRTGSKFSNYAQNITLQTLLVHANRRMERLYNRYLLSMPKSEGELIIIDTYQGNTERAVSTLSGGETFMVSLALALSLSDMASKNVALESLFIDEGFSTLDPEMLELAMTTLDKIQSESQKTVGIISHVESLKERIAVQIHLEKNAQGFSSIQIVS